MSLNLATGNFSSGAHPTTHELRRLARDMSRQLADGASLDLRFVEGLYYRQDSEREDYIEPAFELLAACSRASAKYYPNWSGRSGDPVGRLVRFGVDQRATGAFGPRDESAGENLIEYERTEGAVAGVLGSGGQLPNGWGYAADGTTIEVTDAGSELGWRFVELEVTASGAASPIIHFAGATDIAAATGNERTLSVTARAVGSVIGNFSGLQLRQQERTASAAVLTNTKALEAVTTVLARYSYPVTLSGGGTVTKVHPGVVLAFSGSGTQRLRLAIPQLEAGLVATSPMIKEFGETGTATRAADVITGLTTARASTAYDPDWSGLHGDVGGPLREFLPNVPVIGPRGLLVSPSTTNKNRNSRCLGSVNGKPGAGGALPTNWTRFENDTGVTVEVVGAGDDAFGSYVELEYDGIASGGVSEVRFEATGYVAAAAGQPWASQFGMRVVAGGLSGVATGRTSLTTFMSGGSTITQATRTDVTTYLDRQYRRFKIEAPSIAGSLTHIVSSFRFDFTAAATVLFRIRVYSPQLEQRRRCTAVQLPPPGTIAEATRAADEISMPLGDWFDTDAFSVYVAFARVSGDSGYSAHCWSIDDGTSDERVQALVDPSDQSSWYAAAGGVQQVSETGSLVTAGVVTRMACAFAANDFAGSSTGAAQATDTSVTMPTGLTTLRLGRRVSGDELSGYIRAFRFWTRRLPNAELETLVGN